MTEADLMERLILVVQTVLTLFSVFFTIVSGYLAALFLVLHRASIALRLVAFGLLSVGLVFLGGTAATVGRLQDVLFTAWARLERPTMPISAIRNPLPIEAEQLLGVSQQELGLATGWVVASAVYLALAYLTFLYRWPDTAPGAPGPGATPPSAGGVR